MCEPIVLSGAKQKDGSYNFDYVFDGVREYLDRSDYLVGNLETPLAGEELGYTNDYLCFNAPDAYADAIKRVGFDLISTANNHVFDRGYDGLINTVKALDARDIPHTGTFLPGDERSEAYYIDVDGVRVAVIVYTYGTNFYASGKKCSAMSGDFEGTVNLLRPQNESVFLPSYLHRSTWFDKLTKKFLKSDTRGRIKHFFGMHHFYPRADHNLNVETMQNYVEKFQSDIRSAKEKADIVIFYPHTGGQFDPAPGAITEYVVEKAVEAGADAVIASHAHVVQNSKLINGVPCFYSIGNFNMDPKSGFVVPQYLPGFGLALHLHIDTESKSIAKITFSIICTHVVKRRLETRMADEYYATLKGDKEKKEFENQVRQVYETLLRKRLTGDIVRREYEMV